VFDFRTMWDELDLTLFFLGWVGTISYFVDRDI
jgi:hypothetical protein